MNTEELWTLIADAKSLHEQTQHPLLPSAIANLTSAYVAALQENRDPSLPPVAQIAAETVRRLQEARLTLYSFSCIQGGRSNTGEHRDADDY